MTDPTSFASSRDERGGEAGSEALTLLSKGKGICTKKIAAANPGCSSKSTYVVSIKYSANVRRTASKSYAYVGMNGSQKGVPRAMLTTLFSPGTTLRIQRVTRIRREDVSW